MCNESESEIFFTLPFICLSSIICLKNIILPANKQHIIFGVWRILRTYIFITTIVAYIYFDSSVAYRFPDEIYEVKVHYTYVDVIIIVIVVHLLQCMMLLVYVSSCFYERDKNFSKKYVHNTELCRCLFVLCTHRSCI